MVTVDDVLVVAETVRRWAEDAFAEVPFVADAAVAAAVRALAGGASVSEACREGRRRIDSCRRHPAAAKARREPRARLIA